MSLHPTRRARKARLPASVASVAIAVLTASAFPRPARAADRPASGLARDEASLAEEARLDPILRITLARNPELTEADQRVRAARSESSAVSRWPDPELEYELWGQPIKKPLAFGSTQMHSIGLKQAIPAPGSLGARSEALSAEARVLAQTRRAREQELVAKVRRAYADYYRADREYKIHLAHVALAQGAFDAARAVYQGGRGSQEDVLLAAVETSRLHNDIASIDAARRTSRALLNTLMARPIEAPLGPPAAIEPARLTLRAEELERSLAERPEIAAALDATKAREKELDAARATRRYPSFMVGVQYMYMPPMEEPHHYGVMLSMTLPWFNARYGEEVRAAEARLAADRSALSSVRRTARFELYEATERLKAARESLAILERDLLPQAERSFEAAQAAYRGGQGESLALFRSLEALLDLRLERERAIAGIASAVADVERAAGRPISAATTHRERGERP